MIRPLENLRKLARRGVLAACAALALNGCGGGGDRNVVTVFAAASIAPALEVAAKIWAKRGNPKVRIVTAGSGALARQIEAGAGADIFVSANEDWVEYLADRGFVAGLMPAPLARNRLVLIAPRSSAENTGASTLLAEGRAFARALDRPKRGGRLAIGEPGAVPAGTYAKGALVTLGLWDAVKDRLAPARDVRAALALVERGEAPLGIVYLTDAMASKKAVVVAAFPPGSHGAVAYRVAILKGRSQVHVSDFLAWLRTPLARAVFEKAGFENAGFGAETGTKTGGDE